jgi:hypothetical protein
MSVWAIYGLPVHATCTFASVSFTFFVHDERRALVWKPAPRKLMVSAGDGMPGLADALNSHKALSAGDATRRNPVEEFSDALVNTLPKDAAAAAATHGGIGDTLLRKQQQHNALLQCLHSAGLLAAGAYEVCYLPQTPRKNQ